MAIYYVSAEIGNDDNPGTEEYPFKTIAKALSLVQAGDVVYVMNGVYYEENLNPANSGTVDNWITIQNYPNHEPILDGGYYGLNWKEYERGVWYAEYPDPTEGTAQIIADGNRWMQYWWEKPSLEERIVDLKLLKGTFAYWHNTNTVYVRPYDLEYPDSVVMPYRGRAFNIDKDYIKIKGFKIRFYNAYGIYATGNNIIAEDLTIQLLTRRGIAVYGNGVICKNVKLQHLGLTGIVYDGASNGQVINCETWYCANAFAVTNNATNIKFSKCKANHFGDKYIIPTWGLTADGDAFSLGQSDGVVVKDCVVRNGTNLLGGVIGNAFDIWHATNLTVENCQIFNSAYGIHISGGSSGLYQNNEIAFVNHYPIAIYDSSSNTVQNNKFYYCRYDTVYDGGTDNTIVNNQAFRYPPYNTTQPVNFTPPYRISWDKEKICDKGGTFVFIDRSYAKKKRDFLLTRKETANVALNDWRDYENWGNFQDKDFTIQLAFRLPNAPGQKADPYQGFLTYKYGGSSYYRVEVFTPAYSYMLRFKLKYNDSNTQTVRLYRQQITNNNQLFFVSLVRNKAEGKVYLFCNSAKAEATDLANTIDDLTSTIILAYKTGIRQDIYFFKIYHRAISFAEHMRDYMNFKRRLKLCK